jgi:hypothetical protein
MHLAALGTDDWLDMLGPAPAWLEYGASDGQLSQLDQLDMCLLDPPDLVWAVEALAAQLHGTDRTGAATLATLAGLRNQVFLVRIAVADRAARYYERAPTRRHAASGGRGGRFRGPHRALSRASPKQERDAESSYPQSPSGASNENVATQRATSSRRPSTVGRSKIGTTRMARQRCGATRGCLRLSRRAATPVDNVDSLCHG